MAVGLAPICLRFQPLSGSGQQLEVTLAAGAVFALCRAMKEQKEKAVVFVVGLALTFLFAPPALSQAAGAGAVVQTPDSQSAVPAKHRQTVTAFEERVKAYAKMREEIEGRMPKLAKEATPEEITAHKQAFEEQVRAARAGAKQGDAFTPDVAAYIRLTIRDEFKGKERQELRQTVLEADTKGVPLRVNYSYPESKELVEMPPTLLLKLPQLPKQLRYRFVNRNLLLVDRENGLIVDYMTNAIP